MWEVIVGVAGSILAVLALVWYKYKTGQDTISAQSEAAGVEQLKRAAQEKLAADKTAAERKDLQNEVAAILGRDKADKQREAAALELLAKFRGVR